MEDGHTIHLVPKQGELAPVSSEDVSSNSTAESTLLQSSSEEGGDTAVGSASAGILAALLGLGSSSSNENNDDNEADVEAIFPLPRPRSNRLSARRRSANVYRRFANEPRSP